MWINISLHKERGAYRENNDKPVGRRADQEKALRKEIELHGVVSAACDVCEQNRKQEKEIDGVKRNVREVITRNKGAYEMCRKAARYKKKCK